MIQERTFQTAVFHKIGFSPIIVDEVWVGTMQWPLFSRSASFTGCEKSFSTRTERG